jgi:hypothetical protein
MTRDERARLYAARELVVVDLLDNVLAALDLALALEHPTLDEPLFDRAPVTLRRARKLARTARLLRAELDRYRAAVDASLAAPDREELPF